MCAGLKDKHDLTMTLLNQQSFESGKGFSPYKSPPAGIEGASLSALHSSSREENIQLLPDMEASLA